MAGPEGKGEITKIESPLFEELALAVKNSRVPVVRKYGQRDIEEVVQRAIGSLLSHKRLVDAGIQITPKAVVGLKGDQCTVAADAEIGLPIPGMAPAKIILKGVLENDSDKPGTLHWQGGPTKLDLRIPKILERELDKPENRETKEEVDKAIDGIFLSPTGMIGGIFVDQAKARGVEIEVRSVTIKGNEIEGIFSRARSKQTS